MATFETSQVLLAGVSGGFSRGSPVHMTLHLFVTCRSRTYSVFQDVPLFPIYDSIFTLF